MGLGTRRFRASIMCGIAAGALLTGPTATAAEPTASYHIAAQSLDGALRDFGVQSGSTIMVNAALTKGKSTTRYAAIAEPEAALRVLLQGSGLTYRRQGRVFVVRPADALQPPVQTKAPLKNIGTADQDGQSASTEEREPEIIVTAQKRAERIQDVPIAISAFSSKSLDQQKIEGGSELLRAVPNVTFSKNNFSGFNFSIRGIGTKAVSVTTDPAVAISYNNVPMIRNRLFEQEYFDVERVEVLRGPQGTLYGRNATGGVVNMITNKADPSKVDGELRGEVGNFDTRRLRGFLNIPISDTLAVRVAGATTHRDGFDYNSITDRRVNGRDLWQARGSIRWKPDERFTADLVWEHFEESDNRSRTGKQLCQRDPGPSSVGGVVVSTALFQGILSQGCKPGSLFEDSAYGTPNGLSLPLVIAGQSVAALGYNPTTGEQVTLLTLGVDPYGGMMQSRNLREIASTFDPRFRAKNDVFQLNLSYELTSNIQLFSQSVYTSDTYYSTQDYNRFNTVPVFNDSNGLMANDGSGVIVGGISPGGVFNDPQIGPSNRLFGVDLNQSKSTQFYQEFRIQSSSPSRFNFSVGANYLNYKTIEDYYVFFNIASAINETIFTGVPGVETAGPYIDPNPLSSLAGDGHNYFRSKNPYTVNSKAMFGEVYYQLTPLVKFTGGLRYTDDRKSATPVPSQLLLGVGDEALGGNPAGGGFVARGYPEQTPIKQRFGEFTGRIGLDWRPQLSFTDKTLLYVFFSRGYKGGGANPPGIGADPRFLKFATQPSTFKPEFVNSFEVGSKNTLFNGKLTLNGTAFLYDYKDYQVSKIIDRTALNENIGAKIWGLEFESVWQPSRNFSMNLNIGYLHTRIDNGSKSIDVMDRTQGNPDWTLVKPFLQLASNCVARTADVANILQHPELFPSDLALSSLCGGSFFGDFSGNSGGGFVRFDQIFGFTYNPLTDGPNGGQGFFVDLGGKELPNSPHLTANIGAQYTIPIGDWAATLHGDYYRQGKSFSRVYNTKYDRLKGWGNGNLSLTVGRIDGSLSLQFYVKNVFNDMPITDAFTNSDDSGLTTNVFTLDPRIFGFNVTKRF